MLDLVFESATVIDGTGNAPRTADVGVQDGIIREVGRVDGAAHRRIDANGAWLTPGFIDLHTHYDGQASWDETFSPSVQHGVTTLLFGNCGVGFAPLAPGDRNRAIEGLIVTTAPDSRTSPSATSNRRGIPSINFATTGATSRPSTPA